MTTLKRLFKIEFERGGTGKEPENEALVQFFSRTINQNKFLATDPKYFYKAPWMPIYTNFEGGGGGGG